METVRTFVAKVLLHLERQLDGLLLNLVIHGQCVVNAGKLLRKFDVHHGADDLNDLAYIHLRT